MISLDILDEATMCSSSRNATAATGGPASLAAPEWVSCWSRWRLLCY